MILSSVNLSLRNTVFFLLTVFFCWVVVSSGYSANRDFLVPDLQQDTISMEQDTVQTDSLSGKGSKIPSPGSISVNIDNDGISTDRDPNKIGKDMLTDQKGMEQFPVVPNTMKNRKDLEKEVMKKASKEIPLENNDLPNVDKGQLTESLPDVGLRDKKKIKKAKDRLADRELEPDKKGFLKDLFTKKEKAEGAFHRRDIAASDIPLGENGQSVYDDIDNKVNSEEAQQIQSMVKDPESAFSHAYDEQSLERLVKKDIDYKEHFDKLKDEIPDIKGKVLSREQANEKALNALDSMETVTTLRKKGKAWGKKIEESGIRSLIFNYHDHKGFPAKLFVDILVGLDIDKNIPRSISPSVGYEIGKHWAVGGGVVLTNTSDELFEIHPSVGLKAFARYHILPEQLYIHTEGILTNPRFLAVKSKEGGASGQDKSVLAGLGYRIKLLKLTDINVQLLYYVLKQEKMSPDKSRFTFRIGLKVF